MIKRHVQQNISNIKNRQNLIACVMCIEILASAAFSLHLSAVRLDSKKNPLCCNQQRIYYQVLNH